MSEDISTNRVLPVFLHLLPFQCDDFQREAIFKEKDDLPTCLLNEFYYRQGPWNVTALRNIFKNLPATRYSKESAKASHVVCNNAFIAYHVTRSCTLARLLYFCFMCCSLYEYRHWTERMRIKYPNLSITLVDCYAAVTLRRMTFDDSDSTSAEDALTHAGAFSRDATRPFLTARSSILMPNTRPCRSCMIALDRAIWPYVDDASMDEWLAKYGPSLNWSQPPMDWIEDVER